MRIGLVIFYLVIGNIVTCDDALVDYYEALIKEEIERSTTYRRPSNANEFKPNNSEPEDFGYYDFIVVGGGSAGSVIASGLSEISDWKILLLEAGKEENNFTDIPSMSTYGFRLEYNWGFNSTPQSTCCLATNGVCSYARGKALGGSSVLNALIYARGNSIDYDRWADEGNPGWSYKDVLPYFMKSEDANINGDEGYHGFGGYLSINYRRPFSEKANIFLQANEELKTHGADYNGKEQLSASHIQFTNINGRRESAAKAFLKPVRSRSNLHILTESYVTKIIISKPSKVARGVLFSHRNTLYVAKARKEVILSAGVFGSPQILMLSGVGPNTHLLEKDISVVNDLAVGQTLLDHTSYRNLAFKSPYPEPSFELRPAIEQYLNGTGPLTVSTNQEAIGFYQLSLTNSTIPDVELVFNPSSNSRGFDNEDTGIVNKDNYIFKIQVILLHPKTTGRVYLKSNDPFEYPLIDAACLADPNGEDIETMYRGVQHVLKIMETKAFRRLNATLLPDSLCSTTFSFLSREYWMCVFRQRATNASHGYGTCKMGSNPLEGAVVDSRLKVHGLSNLRVADASIIPVSLSAHINAPSIMIGEKLADIVKEDHNRSVS